jgi:hypothetical protein
MLVQEAISIFTLMSWFLFSNNKSNKYIQKAENIIESKEVNKPNIVKEKQLNINKNLTSKQLESTIEQIIQNDVITYKNKSSKNKNNFIEINENIEVEQTELLNNSYEEIYFINNKSIHLLGVEIMKPIFDFKIIDFVKSPVNYHKKYSIPTYLNASLEVGLNSFNNAFASNSFGYYFGGRLYFDIGKLSFNTNLHFENINQNLAARTYINKAYDFNSITEATTIKNKSIDYAIVGLNAMYPVYKNHSIGIGIQYAQLIKSNDLLSVYNIENNTNSNKNTSNYNSVLNKTDWQLTCNYQNRFSKHFAVNAIYVFGLNDISKNNALALNKVNNNIGFKLGLQYNIK